MALASRNASSVSVAITFAVGVTEEEEIIRRKKKKSTTTTTRRVQLAAVV